MIRTLPIMLLIPHFLSGRPMSARLKDEARRLTKFPAAPDTTTHDPRQAVSHENCTDYDSLRAICTDERLQNQDSRIGTAAGDEPPAAKGAATPASPGTDAKVSPVPASPGTDSRVSPGPTPGADQPRESAPTSPSPPAQGNEPQPEPGLRVWAVDIAGRRGAELIYTTTEPVMLVGISADGRYWLLERPAESFGNPGTALLLDRSTGALRQGPELYIHPAKVKWSGRGFWVEDLVHLGWT